MQRLRAAAMLWRTQGTRAVLSTLAANVYSSERVVRLARPSAWELSTVGGHPSLSIRRLSVPELVRLRDGTQSLPVAFYADRIHGVSRPFVGWWGRELAHISWAFVHGDYSPDIVLAPGQAELRYAHTLKPFRGRGILKAVIRQMASSLAEEGIQTLYAHVVESNTSSLRAFLASGFEVSSRFRMMRVAGLSFVFVEKGGSGL